jgi:hypothetical protein
MKGYTTDEGLISEACNRIFLTLSSSKLQSSYEKDCSPSMKGLARTGYE